MLIIPFFLNSGFPFLTVAITMSPTPAAGNLFNRAPMPLTEIMYRFRAPELSAQDITAPLFQSISIFFPMTSLKHKEVGPKGILRVLRLSILPSRNASDTAAVVERESIAD